MDFKRNYLPDNLIIAVSLQTFHSTTRKCANILYYTWLLKRHWEHEDIILHAGNRSYNRNTNKLIWNTDLHVNACRSVFSTQLNIYVGAFLRKLQKNFVADVRLDSKYASGIGFTVENLYRMSIFIWYSQNRFQNFVIAFLFLEKKHVDLTKV